MLGKRCRVLTHRYCSTLLQQLKTLQTQAVPSSASHDNGASQPPRCTVSSSDFISSSTKEQGDFVKWAVTVSFFFFQFLFFRQHSLVFS